MAFVQAAVYDAVVGVEGRYAPYRFHAHAPRGSSAQAAAVAAAHKVLVTSSPSAKAALDADYAASLAKLPDGKAKTHGIAFGTRAADNLMRCAPATAATPPSCSPSHRRRVSGGRRRRLPADVYSLARLRDAAAGAQRHPVRPAGPARADLGPVHPRLQRGQGLGFGHLDGADGGADKHRDVLLLQRAGQFNAALRDQVTLRHLDIVDAARCSLDRHECCGRDITVWRAKYVYGSWRPITAINLADTDGNPATAPDPSWVPLFPTPAYPEYPSGYNGFNSTSHGLEGVFQTRHLHLTLISTATN